MTTTDPLTKSQAARRQRVLLAALELGADGGYEAVQMRDEVIVGGRHFARHFGVAALVRIEETVPAQVPAEGQRGRDEEQGQPTAAGAGWWHGGDGLG